MIFLLFSNDAPNSKEEISIPSRTFDCRFGRVCASETDDTISPSRLKPRCLTTRVPLVSTFDLKQRRGFARTMHLERKTASKFFFFRFGSEEEDRSDFLCKSQSAARSTYLTKCGVESKQRGVISRV